MKEIRNIRRAVTTMANELRKAGLTLSDAFKKAWRRIKQNMTLRISGTTFNNGQNKLAYLSQIKPENVKIKLHHETDNKFDANAVKVFALIPEQGIMAQIGFIPRAIAAEISKVIDNGISVKAAGQVIGGYADKKIMGIS